MSEIVIKKVEVLNKLDNVYVEVYCECGDNKWVENFCGEEWLQKDENGVEKFVGKVVEHFKLEPERVNVDVVKEKYKDKVIQVE